MADLNLFKRAESLDTGDKFSEYTGVLIYTGKQVTNSEGKDVDEVIQSVPYSESGKILEITNEWGTQEQANNIIADLMGKKSTYQPFTAEGAIADPSFDVGDSVSINGVNSAVCVRATTFDSLMASDISAPYEEEIDHEYVYESHTDRAYARTVNEFKSEFKIQAAEISAKVSATGGSSSSFGWTLTATSWALYSNNSEVLHADKDGLVVKGTVQATKFLTADGEEIATQADLESVMGSYTSSGVSGGCNWSSSSSSVWSGVSNGNSAYAVTSKLNDYSLDIACNQVSAYTMYLGGYKLSLGTVGSNQVVLWGQ